jgi:purine-nucleoside phosphorylase
MNQTLDLQQALQNALSDVRNHTDRAPAVALVLGSGLGAFADSLENATVIPYAEIRGIPKSSVAGHKGCLVLGDAEGVSVVAMQGRNHLYEGHTAAEVVFGARLMFKLGATSMIVTNAAGGIDPEFSVGDLMLLSDHLNLTGQNCLLGPNDDSLGARFVDMTVAYDQDLRKIAREAAEEIGFSLKSGVYAGLLGPTYETPAEIRMLQTIGASAVGMSTVHEVIAARHMSVRCLGISCITNLAAGLGDGTLSHDEVKETADQVHDRFVGLLRGILRKMQ